MAAVQGNQPKQYLKTNFEDRGTGNSDCKCICMILIGAIIGVTLPIFIAFSKGFNHSEAANNSTIISTMENIGQGTIVAGISCMGAVLGGVVGAVSFCASSIFSYMRQEKKV